MRLNQFIASASNLSRRKADEAIETERVTIDGRLAKLGEQVTGAEHVELDGETLIARAPTYIAFNKPVGVVCSHKQQGNAQTVYDILPSQYKHLNTIGRLDKDSCGLVVLTNDGNFTELAAHPRHEKTKQYVVTINRKLSETDQYQLENGVMLDDGISKLEIDRGTHNTYTVGLHEGRNRQVRRSFEALGYQVAFLQRVQFGKLLLGTLAEGKWQTITPEDVI